MRNASESACSSVNQHPAANSTGQHQQELSPPAHKDDDAQDSDQLSFDIISYIMHKALGPLDVLRASQVCREWRRAAREQYLWLAFVRQEFGDTLVRKARPPGSSRHSHIDAKAFYAQLACFTPGALTGWCEDPVTIQGQPYTMYLGEMSSSRTWGNPASLRRTRVMECKSTWTYTVPHPRTKLRIHALAVQPEILDGLRALPVATCSRTDTPFYSQRIKIMEYEKILGLVDVPNSYYAFRVGPVLLGCFLPPDVQLHVVALHTRRQMLGLIVLWDAGLALSSPNSTAPRSTHALQEVSGLKEGEVFTGTVLTNWQERDANNGLMLGHVLMGRIKLTCLEVGPLRSSSPTNSHSQVAPSSPLSSAAATPAPSRSASVSPHSLSPSSSHGGSAPNSPTLHAVAQARLRVEVDEREWLISPQGLPIRYDIEEEPSYTAAAVGEAHVVLKYDGTVKPLAPCNVRRQYAQANREAPSDPYQFDLQGIASGGVLAGLLISRCNTRHRAVFASFAQSLSSRS